MSRAACYPRSVASRGAGCGTDDADTCSAPSGQAGELLYCHRNTVLNRLRGLERLTGRLLDHPRDPVDLTLALEACRTGSADQSSLTTASAALRQRPTSAATPPRHGRPAHDRARRAPGPRRGKGLLDGAAGSRPSCSATNCPP
ncbi:helix-turn-helix domain-containing protein [Streptomyces sp. NBC_01361]|uniref:helix-turn-helix domain-containing protein n=1 Tax=Streptomyces sp. NBC_01361 TaxID=2903838 RepID=UPI002E31D375|nr:helix-turn-helix domain-containing protein [Streptomyces sp. NBC_01361]